MNRLTTFLVSLVFATALVAPAAASAQGVGANANAQAHVGINGNGIVRVIGAEVTSVSGAVINAVTTVGANVLNWAVTVSSATKISVEGQPTASTTAAIAVGDKISFTGMLTGIGSTMAIAATRVRDLANAVVLRLRPVTISSVNAANDSFTGTVGKRTVTVQGNASTTVTVNGATSNIASLQSGDKVKVAGTASADGSVITASSIVIVLKNNAETNNQDNDADNGTGLKANTTESANASGGLHLGIFGWGDR